MSVDVVLDRFKGGICGDAFIGREEQLQTLTKYADAAYPTHLAIYGMPHVGKTSLLREWQRRIEKDGLPSKRKIVLLKATVPVKPRAGAEQSSCASLFRLLFRSSALQKTRVYRKIKKAYQNGFRSAEEAVELLRKMALSLRKRHIRTILILDEFERSGLDWQEDEYLSFASLLLDKRLDLFCVTAARPHISYVLSGFTRQVNPFSPYLLEPFNDTEMAVFFDRFKREGGVDYSLPNNRKELQEYLYVCGRNPFLLTVMRELLSKGTTATPLAVFRTVSQNESEKSNRRGTAGPFREHFRDVVRFMLAEEERAKRSFSHIVKCYFGVFDDYKDIIGIYKSLGYIEVADIDSPFIWDEHKRYVFEDEPGHVCCYSTVSPAFVNHLFVYEANRIQDARDLLMGFVHCIRDVTMQVLKTQWGDDWNRELLLRLYAEGNDCGVVYAEEKPKLPGQFQLVKKADLSPLRSDWIDAHKNEMISIAAPSLNFALNGYNKRNNLIMPILDAINLNDNGEIILRFPSWFEPFFGTLGPLPSQESQKKFKRDLSVIHKVRNGICHFSRYQIASSELAECRNLCIDLLKSMYSFYGDGIEVKPTKL